MQTTTFADFLRRWAAFSTLLLLATLLIWPSYARAQDTDSASGDRAGPAVQAAPNVTADEVNNVARELWCPLCAGVRLDGCELTACDQMKDEIALKLAAGEDTATIKDYFVAQYGPQVLGEPPREGFNLLAWILPMIVLAGGAFFLLTRSRRLLQPSATPEAATAGAATSVGASPNDTTAQNADPYARRLDEELARYD